MVGAYRVIVMSSAEECRQHAAECLQAAKFASNPQVHNTLVSMAQKWNEMAKRMAYFAAQHGYLRGEGPPPPPNNDDDR